MSEHDELPNWADGPLAGLDTETTGTDPTSDRIVTATLVSFRPGKKPAIHRWIADPEVEIPEQATEVHGITTEHARIHGRPAADVLAEIEAMLLTAWSPTVPLVVCNAPFDLPLLQAELRRHHGRELHLAGPVIDPLCIDREVDKYRRGKRRLENLCEHYRVRLDAAHDSSADTLGAMRVAWRLAKKYPTRIGQVDPAELHERQTEWYRIQQLGFADYLERLAAAQNDADEAAQLSQRAADARAAADAWPLPSLALIS